MGRSCIDAVRFVINTIQNLDVRPHPQSRLMRMHKLFERSHSTCSTIQPDHAEFETAIESLRDIRLLEFVFDNLHGDTCDDAFPQLVKRTIKDSVLPQLDLEQSPGRDAQFELYLAALCHASGLRPAVLEEPDVTCVVEGVKFGIAAKRLKSIKEIGNRIKEAADR